MRPTMTMVHLDRLILEVCVDFLVVQHIQFGIWQELVALMNHHHHHRDLQIEDNICFFFCSLKECILGLDEASHS